uniref:BRI3 binding protein n=1 Tax=Macaca fascicularis TaxID=9541 RepID=A0A2K5VVW3_MACFA
VKRKNFFLIDAKPYRVGAGFREAGAGPRGRVALVPRRGRGAAWAGPSRLCARGGRVAQQRRRRWVKARRAAPERANPALAGARGGPAHGPHPAPRPRTPPAEHGRARLRPWPGPGSCCCCWCCCSGCWPRARRARGRGGAEKNSYRRTVNTFSQSVSSLFGEDNVRAAQKFLARLTERFVLGVDMFVETLWKVWTELLDVLGLDVSNLSQYFSPASVSSSPARALLLVGVVLLAYWFLSLTLGFTFSILHVVFGRFFWIVRVVLFSMSCVYILHKYEGEPENAVLPLCFVVAVYFMTGPMGFYWRSSPSGPSNPSNPSVEEKLEHLEKQVRLLNIRLNRVLESLDRSKDK